MWFAGRGGDRRRNGHRRNGPWRRRSSVRVGFRLESGASVRLESGASVRLESGASVRLGKVGWRVRSRVWAQWEKMIWKLLLLNKFAVEKKRQGFAILKGMILLMHLHEEAYYWYKLGGKYIQPSISDPPTRERYLRQNVGGDNGNRISRSDQTLIEPNLLNEQMEHWRL